MGSDVLTLPTGLAGRAFRKFPGNLGWTQEVSHLLGKTYGGPFTSINPSRGRSVGEVSPTAAALRDPSWAPPKTRVPRLWEFPWERPIGWQCLNLYMISECLWLQWCISRVKCYKVSSLGMLLQVGLGRKRWNWGKEGDIDPGWSVSFLICKHPTDPTNRRSKLIEKNCINTECGQILFLFITMQTIQGYNCLHCIYMTLAITRCLVMIWSIKDVF